MVNPIDLDPNKLLELAAEKLAKQMNPDRLVDAEEAGQLFACSPRHFAERIACKPGFPAQKRCGRWRYGDLVKHIRMTNRAA